MMVTLVGLLREHHNLALTDYEVAEMSHHIERVDMGMLGGMQDQYAATFGGFNFIEFGADRVIVNPLRVSADVVNELEHNLLLCYTGATRPLGRRDRGSDRALRGWRCRHAGRRCAARSSWRWR